MNFLDHALALARAGFRVFPLVPMGKRPALKRFPVLASTDVKAIPEWWHDPVTYRVTDHNVGISTEGLLVLDVDMKDGFDGEASILIWELRGWFLPRTYTQRTPTGGVHVFFRAPYQVANSVRKIAPGIDVRGKGGYVVGRGSATHRGEYTGDLTVPVAEAPQWLLSLVARAPLGPTRLVVPPLQGAALEQAKIRAVTHLAVLPPAPAGQRDDLAYKAACKCRDVGLDLDSTYELMLEHWKSEPQLEDHEVYHAVASAYTYAQGALGSADPAREFDVVVDPKAVEGEIVPDVHPLEALNRQYFYVSTASGTVFQEFTDHDGKPRLKQFTIEGFHNHLAAETFKDGAGKYQQTSKLWIKSPKRRSYDGMVFVPEKPVDRRWYNLWRGFAVEPARRGEAMPTSAKLALDAFLEHAMVNVCANKHDHFHWLLSWFAHLVQTPWEKPLIAPVFQGLKGTGKTALVERVGDLLRPHFMAIDKEEQVHGRFNSHMENLLLFCWEEAVWAFNKANESTVKGLVTGTSLVIERKGQEPYSIDNRMRIAVTSNATAAVPVSDDERRWAIFRIGNGRRLDTQFFYNMRIRMQEKGGGPHLLRYLLDYDIAGLDINIAPDTPELRAQKDQQRPFFEQWWRECLGAGRLIGSDLDGWAEVVEKDRFRQAVSRYYRERNLDQRIPDERTLGRALFELCPAAANAQIRSDGRRVYAYNLPALDVAKAAWEERLGRKEEWE